MMRSRAPVVGDAFDLRVDLRHIKPAIWRTLRVPAHVTLADLHQVLQVAFGWDDCHLHDFLVREISFGVPDVEDDVFYVDENAAQLGAIAREGSKFMYRYDFGDGWEHDVRVEGMTDGGGHEAITCTGGARACPPEDCGGPPGYERLLDALANAKHVDHADMKAWVPRGFKAEKFDAGAVNKKLAALAKRLGRRRK